MGHGVDAAQLATLAVGSLRNTRRRGAELAEQARAVNAALAEHARPDQFVTGLLLRVDLATGSTRVVNAGHVAPLRIRDGQVSEIPLPADVVFGLFPDVGYDVHELMLEPGDRLVLLTDGMLERNAAERCRPPTARRPRRAASSRDRAGTGPRRSARHRRRAARRRHRARARLVRRRRRPPGNRRRQPQAGLPLSRTGSDTTS
jgi:hypothetical protein